MPDMGTVDVTPRMTERLMEVARLAIAAQGNMAGGYAIIARATLGADGTIVLDWDWYYNAPQNHKEA